ncbi:YhcB family protein [Thiotrichales bacterium 19S11-10]|nr:YhcB family protein [Thiotrichales bacterium 19S11-10]
MFIVLIILAFIVGLIVGALGGFLIARRSGKMARLQAEASNAKKALREYHGKLKSHMSKADNLIHTISDAMLELQEHQYAATQDMEYRSRGFQLSQTEASKLTHSKTDDMPDNDSASSTEAPKDYVVNKKNV